MTVKIKTSNIEFDKALSHSNSNSFEMQDVTPIVNKTQVKPRLLTQLFGGTINSVFLETNVFKYDELTDTLQLPDGKRYDAYGKDIQKDKARQLIYEVGSFGIRGNVSPKDYANRRIPGTTDTLMDEAYLVSRMNAKQDAAWAMFMELAIALLLTDDTNIIRGGPQPVYNYFTDILGVARGAPQSMDLDSVVADHFQLFNDEKDLLEEDLEKTFNTSDNIVVICGKDFFNKRLVIEKQQGSLATVVSGVPVATPFVNALNREMRGQDLASQPVPTMSDGSRFPYQTFSSHDGLTYIRYSASILGTKMIADDLAFMVPLGAETFMKTVYSPAQTRQYVNTVAQQRYGWSREDDRVGVTLWSETNCLPITVNPQLIRALII